MKKYLMTGVAALAFAATFTSCSKTDLYDEGAAKEAETQKQTEQILASYNQAFLKTFGQPAADQDWGFGSSTVAGTRAVPGIEFPDDFSDKTDIIEPKKNNFGKPSITKNDATVSTGSYNEWPSINSGSTVYLEENAVLKLYNQYDPNNSISLQNVNLYMSKGSRLEVPTGLYISGTTKLVNDEGTIVIGSDDNKKNIWSDNFTGIFWNNGSIEGIQDIGTSNDGGTFYFGSKTSFTASNISLNKVVKFWNEGEITLTGKFEAKEYGHEIYNSGTITTPKINLPKETVLWNEGTITAANSKEIDLSVSNDAVQIYNGTNATLKLETLPFNNNYQLVLNEGTLNVKGKITIPNNSEIVNYNTLTAGEFEMKSGGKFYNVAGGEVTIDGLSKIANDGSGSNKDNVWRNGGKYTTGSFEATGGCQNPAAFNNCHMTVTGKFYMNHSNFVLDGGAAVECASFEWKDDNYFHMGGKALLKVTGQLLANNDDTGYGFYGDDTDYAVIQAGSIEKASEGKFRAAYFGNLFIDTDDHFEQGRSSADGTWYYFDDTVKFSFDDNSASTDKKATKAKNFSITIPADPNGCTPGYKYGESYDVCIIAEDLSATDATDYDFNDVVFEVKYTSETTATVQLKAAGGTLPLTVADNEVHAKFGYPDPDPITGKYKMINTGAKADVNGATAEPFTVTNIDRSKRGKDIIIKVNKGTAENPNWIEMQANAGEPAAKLAVESGFEWCDERQPIATKYPKFPEYVKDKKVVWY